MKPFHLRQPWQVNEAPRYQLPPRTSNGLQAYALPASVTLAPQRVVTSAYPQQLPGYPLQRPQPVAVPHRAPPLPRMLRATAAVQLMEEPSMQSNRLPWVIQEPGDLVLTSGTTRGDWVQLLFCHLRKGWAPLSSFVPEPRGGVHGDGLYDGLNRAICSHQSEMLRVTLDPVSEKGAGKAAPSSFHLQDASQAYVWLPPKAEAPLPLLLVLHGSRPMDWDFLSQFAERWQKDAAEYQIAVVVPESKGPTWDYLLTCQRKDMDFIQSAINEVRRRVWVDDKRIAVMGMSDGASLALSMALRNPRVFTTALVQATGFFHDPLPTSLKPRVYMEYGEEDQLFEPTRVALPNRDRLREDGCFVEFVMVPSAGHMVREEFFSAALDFWLEPVAKG